MGSGSEGGVVSGPRNSRTSRLATERQRGAPGGQTLTSGQTCGQQGKIKSYLFRQIVVLTMGSTILMEKFYELLQAQPLYHEVFGIIERDSYEGF